MIDATQVVLVALLVLLWAWEAVAIAMLWPRNWRE